MPFPYPFPIEFGVWPSMAVVMQNEIQDIVKGSILVDTRIEERSVASFTVEDVAEAQSYQRGEPVAIYDTADERIFGGFIANPEQQRMAPAGGLYHPIQCMDNHYLADKRRIAVSYTGQTCGFIVTDIHTKYLADEGVGIGNIEIGPILIEAVFNYVRASDALDALAEKAGKIWYIDEINDLYFVNRDITAAPWSATGFDMIKGSTKMSGGNPMYRNRQYVRGGRDITGPQIETFTGDGVTVAFTVGYSINSVPTVTVGGAPQTVGIKGIDDTTNCYWSKGDPTIVFDAGSIPGAVAVVITYIGQYDILVLVTDEDEIDAQKAIEGDTTTGFVDDIADETKLDDKDAMFESGEAKLDKYGVNRRKLHYDTIRLGLRPGQIQSITYSPFGLVAEEMLIESVKFRGLVKDTVHEITAIQGSEEGSWARYFERLGSQKDEIMDRLNVGTDQLLIILITRAETWEWSESITTTPFACTAVNAVPCGGATPVVC